MLHHYAYGFIGLSEDLDPTQVQQGPPSYAVGLEINLGWKDSA